MSKHTHEIWTACSHGDYGDYDGESIVILGDDMRIAVVLGSDTPETRANAKLIAAAPKLLQALKANHQWHLDHDEFSGYEESEIFSINTMAIAKAEGGAA